MRVLITAFFLLASTACALAAQSGPWPGLQDGAAYTAAPPMASPPPAVTAKAPLVNAKGETVVFFTGQNDGLEAFIDDAYQSPPFKKMWDELVNDSGTSMQLQWWNFNGKHLGAYAAYDPSRNEHAISVGIDPVDFRTGQPLSSQLLTGNIMRAVSLAYTDWQLWIYAQQHAPHKR